MLAIDWPRPLEPPHAPRVYFYHECIGRSLQVQGQHFVLGQRHIVIGEVLHHSEKRHRRSKIS